MVSLSNIPGLEALQGRQDKGILEELGKRGYKPDVATALLPHAGILGVNLKAMDAIDDDIAALRKNASPDYHAAYAAMKALGKQNPAFATAMAAEYVNDPGKYRDTLIKFTQGMAEHPEMAKKVKEMSEKGLGSDVIKLAKDYKEHPATTLAQIKGIPQGSTTTGLGQNSNTSPSRSRNTTSRPSSSTTGPSSTPPVAPASDEIDEHTNLTEEQALKLYGEALNMRDGKFKAYVENNKLDGDIRAVLKKDPNRAHKFADKSDLKDMMSQDRAGFMKIFAPYEQPKDLKDMLAGLKDDAMKSMGLLDEVGRSVGLIKAGQNPFSDMLAPFMAIFSGGMGRCVATQTCGIENMFAKSGPPNLAKLLDQYGPKVAAQDIQDSARRLAASPDGKTTMGNADAKLMKDVTMGGKPVAPEQMAAVGRGEFKVIGERKSADGKSSTYDVRMMTGDEIAALAQTKVAAAAKADETLQRTLQKDPAVLTDEELRQKGAQPSPVAPQPDMQITPIA